MTAAIATTYARPANDDGSGADELTAGLIAETRELLVTDGRVSDAPPEVRETAWRLLLPSRGDGDSLRVATGWNPDECAVVADGCAAAAGALRAGETPLARATLARDAERAEALATRWRSLGLAAQGDPSRRLLRIVRGAFPTAIVMPPATADHSWAVYAYLGGPALGSGDNELSALLEAAQTARAVVAQAERELPRSAPALLDFAAANAGDVPPRG